MKIKVKFCGLKHQNEVDICADFGVAYIGFVFYAKSPRFITLDGFSQLYFTNAPQVVAVFQNPTVDEVKQVLDSNHVDYIQIHGSDDVLHEFKDKVGSIKAISGTDFTHIESQADFLLFDGTVAGSGQKRDFSFVESIQANKPFFLAGGININNFKDAIKYTNYIDLSSGIEETRGTKSIQMMKDFMTEVQKVT